MGRSRKNRNKREERQAFVAAEARKEADLQRKLRIIGMGLALVLFTLIVYAFPLGNSFEGVFLFDDFAQLQNGKMIRADEIPLIRKLRFRRPIPYLLSIANFKQSGMESTFGYHVVNFAIHAIAGLALFGIVRRALRSPRLEGVFGKTAEWIAFTFALIWMVHPLQTQAVTYIVQRAESLMGMFYLLTIYFVARGADSRKPWVWYIAATLACLMGAMSKAIIFTAPLVALIYDATFLAGSYKSALRKRWPVYVLLCLTLIKLGMGEGSALRGSFSRHGRDTSVGFDVQDISSWDYLRSQAGVILHYLRLSVYPHPQCLDYYWPVATVGDALLPGLAILAMLGATVWALIYRPAWGFLGAAFFLILAPTSSFVPIKDLAVEHRMYLPLASVVGAFVIGGFLLFRGKKVAHNCGHLNRPWAQTCGGCGKPIALEGGAARGGLATNRVSIIAIAGLVVIALSARTIARNADYTSEKQMWQRVIDEIPSNDRGWYHLGRAHARQQEWQKAMELYQEALDRNPLRYEAWSDMGTALDGLGRKQEAIEYYEKALELKPRLEVAEYNLGTALMQLGRLDEAIEHLRRAIKIKPYYTAAKMNLANALMRKAMANPDAEYYKDLLKEVEALYAEVLNDQAGNQSAMQSRGAALIRLGQTDAARNLLKIAEAKAGEPQAKLSVRYYMGLSYVADGDLENAWKYFDQLAKLRGNASAAYYEIASFLRRDLQPREALKAVRRSLELEASNPHAKRLLNQLQEELGESQTNVKERMEWTRDQIPSRRQAIP